MNNGEMNEMNVIVNNLINFAKPKVFRGKETNRRMINLGSKYYDTTHLPYISTIDPLIKKYFDIDDEYDNCFINIYEHTHSIGRHCDKDFGMDRGKDIISVSIGVKNNKIVKNNDITLGWMKINDVKVTIHNNQKFRFDYNTPHEAKTLIKSQNVDYRINFTFRASKKQVIELDDENEVINEDTMNYIYEMTELKKKKVKSEANKYKNYENIIYSVLKNIELRKIIFDFQHKIFQDVMEKSNEYTRFNGSKIETQKLQIGDKIRYCYSNLYITVMQVYKITNCYVFCKDVTVHTIIIPYKITKHEDSPYYPLLFPKLYYELGKMNNNEKIKLYKSDEEYALLN